MNKNVVLNAVPAYTANKNKINVNNYHCNVDGTILSGGYDNYYGPHYFRANAVFPLAEAESWEIQFDYQFLKIKAINTPAVFGSASSSVYDSPMLYLYNNTWRYYVPLAYNQWRYQINLNITPVDGQWYRFKIGKTSDFTYYFDYMVKSGDTWPAEYTRVWSDQPTTVNKNIYTKAAMMFLNKGDNPDAYYTNSKIDLNTLKVYINNDLYWSAISDFALDELVYCNKGFAQVGEDVEAVHLLNYLHGNCSELGKVTAVNNDTVTVMVKAEGQSTESPYESHSDVITTSTASPNNKTNSDVVFTITQDTANISTYGTHEAAAVTIAATQDDATIECTTMLDNKPVDYTSSGWSSRQEKPFYGYEIITQPVPTGYTSRIHYGGQDYTETDFPVLCKTKDWVTAWIKDPNDNLVSYKNYEMNISHLIYYQTVTVTCPIESTTISVKVNGQAWSGTSVYAWPGDIVSYTVTKPGYEDWVASYTVPVLPNVSTQTLVVDILYPLPAKYEIETVPAGANVSLVANNKTYSGFSNSNYLLTAKSFYASSSYKIITKVTTVHGTTWNTLFADHGEDYDFGLNSDNNLYWDVYGGGTSLNFVPTNGGSYWIALVRDGSTYSAYILEDTGAYNIDTVPEFRFWTLLRSGSGSSYMFNDAQIDIGNWRGSNYPWLGTVDITNTKIWSDGAIWFDGKTAVEGEDYLNYGCSSTNIYSQDNNAITVPLETSVDWIAAKYGYKTQYGTISVTQPETVTVTLEPGDDSTHAFRTDGTIVEGDKVKINDGMATNADQKWSAYKENTTVIGDYTQDMVVTHVDTENNVAYCAGKPGPDEYDATVEAGEIYHAYTYTDTQTSTSESIYVTDDPVLNTFNEWTQPTLTANGTLGGNSFAVYSSAPIFEYQGYIYEPYCAFDNNSNTCWSPELTNANDPIDLIIYNPNPLKVMALHWEVFDYDRRPVNWEWYGSNDNETYTLISSGTNSSNDFTLNFTPSAAYKYHKFRTLASYNYLNAKQITLTAKEQRTPSTLYNSNFQPLNPQPAFEATTFKQPILNASGTMGGSTFAVSADGVFGSYYTWYPFAANANTDQAYTWAKSGNTGNYYFYNPTPIKVQSIELTNRNEASASRAFTSGTVYGSNDYSTWTELATFTNDNIQENYTWTIDVNATTAYSYYRIFGRNNDGFVGIGKIKINVAGDTITIANEEYKKTPENDIVKGITSTINLQDNTSIHDVTVTTPTQGYHDYTFHAYEPASGTTYYATDNPISLGKFIFDGMINNDCPRVEDAIYQGGSGKYLKMTTTPALSTAESWEIKLKTTYNGGSTYPALMGSTDSSFFHAPHVHFMNGVLKVWISSNGSSWFVEGGATTCPATAGATYYIKYGFEPDPDNTGKYQYYVWWSTVGWEDTGTKDIIRNNTTNRQYCSAPLVFMNIYGNNQNYSGAYYYDGTMDASELTITIDGVTTSFGSMSNPSLLYEKSGDDFVAIDPQPEFIKSAGNLIINDIAYIRNSADDEDKRVFEDPVITFSTTVTKAHNALITDGSYKLVNITVPADKIAIIQSKGANYNPTDFPCLMPLNSSITVAMKDTALSDTFYNYWIWRIHKDYDLHYQEIVFNVNVTDPNIIFKIGTSQVTGNRFYVYPGDSYSYTIKKTGYTPVSGSGTVTYSAKDGKVTTINITMEEAPATELDVTNYNYTQEGDNVMLTEYIGEATEVKVPDVGE